MGYTVTNILGEAFQKFGVYDVHLTTIPAITSWRLVGDGRMSFYTLVVYVEYGRLAYDNKHWLPV